MNAARLLIVEDEIIIARELEARLNALGYDVRGIAASGRQALQAAEEMQPDLVLMDVVLRGDMDGIETAAELRRRHGMPVIYVTAYTDEQTLTRAKITAPYGYIVKPFSERELHANVEMALYRHQAETRQRNVERWFAASMRRIADGVTATDREQTVTFLNPMAESITGWRRDEAVGRKVRDVFNLVSRSAPGRSIDPIHQALTDGIAVELAQDIFLVNRFGEGIPIDYSAACLRDDEGEATGVVVVFRDLRERRRTEELLRTTQQQLLHAQKMEAIGRLAGGVAHDFNNLLTIIQGYGDLLKGDPALGDASQQTLSEILHAADRAAALTRQLLIFSRRQVGEPKEIDINALVANTEQMLRRVIGEDITLTTALALNLGRVRIDPGQLEQVIMNLAVNARDAMDKGGRLTIETAPVELDESYADDHPEVAPGPYVMLAVSDTGCGMSPEVKVRLFEPFFTTKGPGKGTGLGLATVYGIVKQSGGSVFVYSEPGRGTTFKIYLPLVQETLTPPRPGTTWKSAPRGSETVLLVEDEEAVRRLSVSVLSKYGYTVLEACDAHEALRVFDGGQSIDILVTDVVMPGISGRELAEQLQARRPALSVLYISGYTDDAVIRHGVLREDVAFLQKPYSPSALAIKVREVLDTRV